eukprot:TRINITY_DN84833_c0_g1_i1.p1 TRINITY_DN84833_c0_g1~~TRINITY_DN84833_c0_g1_i1.p1  ORF type:complete len:292 (-),score=-18.90 TRINITY_DN84833_c0_g1_i1:33-908(-)
MDVITEKISPCKSLEEFRNFSDSKKHDQVANHYKMMRMNHTMDFADKMAEKYDFSNGKYRKMMTIKEAFHELLSYVDASDPDADLPNKIHMLQTAEGIRKAGHPDWMQIVGLIHDMGKIMFLWGEEKDGQKGTKDGAQWALGGDTWVLGCKIPDVCVFPEYNTLNPDMHDDRYNTEYGIYSSNCGFENLNFAYGHDEYLYQMLLANNTTIPIEGLAMIRYHSCYPWHTGGAYRHLMNEGDHNLLKWILDFNKCDLYTKDNNLSEVIKNEDKLWDYYSPILDKYGLGDSLKW